MSIPTGQQDANPRPAPSGAGRRLLIVGLDGATFDVLDPLIEAGRMPRLRAAIEAGISGYLRSTTPPITPAAWTTFLTGKQPGRHGIIDFERYDPTSNALRMNSTKCLDHVRNLWQILGDRGLRVGSINVPMTYPATAVNGFLISGFETPGVDSDFVYPPELKARILERWPDPTLRTNWRRKRFGGDALFSENVAYMLRSFHQGAAMTRWCGNEMGWDVLMVVLKLVDNLQHKTWRYIDPRWAQRNPTRHEITLRAFEELDRAVGDLLDYAQENEATVLMVSDHGHGSLEGKVQANLLLKEWGYLSLRGGGARAVTRAKYLRDRTLGKARRFARSGNVLHDLAVDFTKTRACVMHAGMAGFVYLNLKGRQPTGIVEGKDYQSLRDELKERFLGSECRVRDPKGNEIQLFSEVHEPEELYGCTREEQPWLPDLILTPHETLAVIRKIRGRKPVRWLSERRIEGTHRPDGILIATGPGIARRERIRCHIVDCAPTILTLLGLPVPDDMEGKVIADLFDRPPTVERESAAAAGSAAATSTARTEEVYSEEDLARITERLSDLGYLE